MSKLKVGIAGYGIVGKKRQECIDRNSNLELVAVCDCSFNSLLEKKDGVSYFNNYQSLLEKDLDILFVCLPNDVAANVTIAGLNKGLHVFCEKPPGRNVKDILSVIECEQKHPKLKLMYGFNHRHHDSVKEAERLIKSGEFGKIINMRRVYGKSKLINFNQTNWRTKREIAGGGILLDQGIHMVDLMRLFAGEFSDIKSFVSNNHWGFDVEDNAYAIMRTNTGIVGFLHSSATQWRHRFSLDINLEKGSINLSGILSGTKSYGAESLTLVYVNHEKSRGNPREQITYYNNDPSWDDEISQFCDCIINDKKVESSSSTDALNTMRLVFKIYYADNSWRNSYRIPNPDDESI